MSIKERLNDRQRRSLYWILDLLPDSLVLKLQYYASLGRKLNLQNPERFTEKIQWYKLNYRKSLMTQCADKYLVRDYVEKKGYSRYLADLYAVYDSFDQIEFDKLPMSFAIKANNGSGTNIFITDKNKSNYREIEKTIKSWGKVNTLSIGREWAYKDIEPKIIIEELLIPIDSFQIKNGLNDYKFLCFNGEPKYVWVDIKRHTDHRRNFYDLHWNRINVVTDKLISEEDITKPYGFDTMLKISREIAKDFPFIRVDFYSLNNKVYIGELTFYPWSSTVQFTPDDFDYELGRAFKLPTVTK